MTRRVAIRSRLAGPRAGRGRWGVAALTAAVLAGLAGCTGLPASGPVATATLNQNQSQNISITAKGPSPGSAPSDVVAGFLAATAGDDGDPDFRVGQSYMDGNAQVGAKWVADPHIAAGDATVVSPSPHVPFTAVDKDAKEGETATVAVTVTAVATLDHGGVYTPDSESLPLTYKLTKVKTPDQGLQWRITEAPARRVITLADLRRAYQALPVFEPVDHSASQSTATVKQIYVVPSDPTRVFAALTRAVLSGPDGSADPKQPSVAVDTAKGQVTVGVATMPQLVSGTPVGDLQSLKVALLRTFQAALPALQLGGNVTKYSLTVSVGGTSVSDTLSLSPPGTYPTVYYASGGTVKSAVRGLGPGSATNGPRTVLDAGADSTRKFGTIAVRKEKATTTSEGAAIRIAAVVLSGPGHGDVAVYSDLFPDKTNADAPAVAWYHAADPTKVTDLAWDPIDNSLWVIDAGNLFKVGEPQNNVPAKPVQIAPFNDQPFQRIQLSPDGENAVVVTGAGADDTTSTGTSVATLAGVTRPDTGAPVGAGVNLPLLSTKYVIQPALPNGPAPFGLHIGDVAWAGGRTIVLLANDPNVAKSGAPPKIYKVYADGSQDADLVEDVEQAEGQATTRIVAATPDSGGQLIQIFSNGDKSDDRNKAIYVRNKTFDFFDGGDNPVLATELVSGP